MHSTQDPTESNSLHFCKPLHSVFEDPQKQFDPLTLQAGRQLPGCVKEKAQDFPSAQKALF